MNRLLIMKKCLLLLISYLFIACSTTDSTTGNTNDSTAKTYVAKNDVVVMEAESAELLGPWRLGTEVVGYTGEGYIYSAEDGIRYQNERTVLAYKFSISKPGDYRLIIRSHYTGDPMDLENDLFTKIDDGDWVKTFNHDRFHWNWKIGHDVDHVFTKPPLYQNLEAGEHTLYLGARSHNFRLDRIHLYHESVPLSVATDPMLPETFAHMGKADSKVESSNARYTYMATSDFDYKIEKFSPSYVNGEYLAIDPIAHESKPAAAELNFDGKNGTYDVTITTLAEFDGESQYVLAVNGAEISTFQTSPVQDQDSELQQTFTWKDIKIEKGDKIGVISIANSNGIYPEEGAPGGFAWSRARWSKIELDPS